VASRGEGKGEGGSGDRLVGGSTLRLHQRLF